MSDVDRTAPGSSRPPSTEPSRPSAPVPLPEDWRTALVLVAHPDDPEYGMSPAVARWTAEGRTVAYVLATSGEAGIEGMDPAQAGPLREAEQRRSAAIVGVDTVEFLGFPDGRLADDDALRAALVDAIRRHRPELVVALFSGPEFAPGHPNQSDHMVFGAAVTAAVSTVRDADPRDAPRYHVESGPVPTHYVAVDGEVERAVKALAAHEVYLSVLDPDTPVAAQARAQVEAVTAPRGDIDHDGPVVGFRDMDDRDMNRA